MCTAIRFQSKDQYFGRTLDLEYSYHEKVTVTPRNFPLPFRSAAPLQQHYAFIGIATLANGYPLYYDGVNEHGLYIAGLNFPGNASYSPVTQGNLNIAHFEIIPWVLGSFRSTEELERACEHLTITDIPFSEEYPISHLHWFVGDKDGAIVIERTREGLSVCKNPAEVLTNNPPLPYQLDNLKKYLHLSNQEVQSRYSCLSPDSRGTGSEGLPGDLTSRGRFVRAYFTKENSVCKDSESASVSQVFHILNSVSVTQGCILSGNQYVKTEYCSCCNASKGIYYYTTYENSQITGVRLRSHILDGKELTQYPLTRTQQFRMEN